jgi:hypothetical protein
MEEVTFRIEHVFYYELKAKFTQEMYANIAINISSEEISDSNVWVIHGEDEDKCYALMMLQKKDEMGHETADSVRITHFGLKPGFFEQDILLGLYLHIETYYVNNAVNCVKIVIPKIRGFTTKATKFFKRIGFKKFIIYSPLYPDGAVLLIKPDLKKWYYEENGEYKPRIEEGSGG